MIWII